jgi:hypothetical protein
MADYTDHYEDCTAGQQSRDSLELADPESNKPHPSAHLMEMECEGEGEGEASMAMGRQLREALEFALKENSVLR